MLERPTGKKRVTDDAWKEDKKREQIKPTFIGNENQTDFQNAADIASIEYYPNLANQFYVFNDESSGGIRVTISNEYDGIEITVYDKHVHIDHVRFDSNNQGVGNGAAWFDSVVTNSINQNKEQITLKASKSENDNGYYTWARLGFDAPIKPYMIAEARNIGIDAFTVMDLMRTQKGRDLWKKKGHGFDYMTFNLSEDSTNMLALKVYIDEKRRDFNG
ncbi:MAG: hypothetical protein FWH05_01865 [Oscillospiraceae bacterium]|nr:hypothetical protein [Oscillospiraceae bacterium]